MPKMSCPCGYVFNLSNVPCAQEYNLIPEGSLYEFIQALESKLSFDPDVLLEVLEKGLRSVLLCPQCGRLHLEQTERSGKYSAYVREES